MSQLVRFLPSDESTSNRETTSIFDLLGKRYGAWKTEQEVALELRRIQAEQSLIQARRDLALTECEARQQLLQSVTLLEEATAEQQFRQALRSASDTEAQAQIARAIETERLLLEREQIRQHRLSGGTGTLPEKRRELPPAPQGERALEVHLTDDQIKTLALRAVTRFGQMKPEEADIQWQRWEEELPTRYPPHIVAELRQAVAEMRGLLR